MTSDVASELRARIDADIAFDGGKLSERRAIAWRGYLAALLEWGVLDVSAHGSLVALIPPIDPDPVADILMGRPD